MCQPQALLMDNVLFGGLPCQDFISLVLAGRNSSANLRDTPAMLISLLHSAEWGDTAAKIVDDAVLLITPDVDCMGERVGTEARNDDGLARSHGLGGRQQCAVVPHH